MLVRTAHRFTVEEYYRMAETGVIKPGARVELLDGELIDMSPIGPWHGGVVNKLNRLFTEQAKDKWLVTVQNPIHLDSFSEPEPDLMLLRPRADHYATRHPTAEDVFLLIEVADSTIEYDRNLKLPAYGRAGVPEVWIVNLPAQAVEIYREPHFSGYASTSKLVPGDVARPQAFPSVEINVAALLRQQGP